MPELQRVAERSLILGRRDGPVLGTLSSWWRASSAAARVVRGSRSRKAVTSSASKATRSGSCHSTGPNAGPSDSTPEAKKLANGVSTSRSRLRCVMNRPPFTAKTKSSGTVARHCWYDAGRWSE